MIYLTTNADGLNTEGIGAMVQYQLFCYSLSRHLGVEYLFEGFRNLNHWQYNGTDQETFVRSVNDFFDLPTTDQTPSQGVQKISIASIDDQIYDLLKFEGDLIIDINPSALMNYGQLNIATIEENGWIKSLRPRIGFKTGTYSENTDFCITVHIRKYTQTDCDPSPVRDLYDDSKREYYVNLIKSLNNKFSDRNPKVKIFSQGSISDFEFLNHFENVELHIEEHPLASLYSMINSDVFVMSNSSLSYIASLFRDSITFKKINFYHVTYDLNIYIVSEEGEIR